VKGESLEGWRVMFVVLGLVTVAVGVVTFFFLPDTPMRAAFLSEDEKVFAIRRVGGNKTGIENRKFKWLHVKELALDVQIYLLVLVTVLVRFDYVARMAVCRDRKLADGYFLER
jgi:predicted MFS family arabinose efflux permease